MKDFARKVLEGSEITPPDICLTAFEHNFKGSVNIDWFRSRNHYEAVFYKNDIEHIAIFNASGELEEYRKYLSFEFLPETIKNILEQKGELMNVVLINQGNCIKYEAIIRDKELNRYLVLLNDLGKVYEERLL